MLSAKWYNAACAALRIQHTTKIDKLSTEIARILAMPEVREKLNSQGMDPFISTPEQFAAMMKADMGRFANIIKTANIKVEN